MKNRLSDNQHRKACLDHGRDGEIRTRDLTHPKRARYQAAPRPVKLISVWLEKLLCQTCGMINSRRSGATLPGLCRPRREDRGSREAVQRPLLEMRVGPRLAGGSPAPEREPN